MSALTDGTNTMQGGSTFAPPATPASVATATASPVTPPVDTTKPIDASALGSSSTKQYPTTPTPTTATDTLNSTLAGYFEQLKGLSAQLADQQKNQQSATPTAPKSSLQDTLANILNLNNQIGQKGQDTIDENNKVGLADKLQKANDVTNQMAARSRYYDNAIRDVQTKNPLGASANGINDKVNELTQQKNRELADLAIQQAAANGDYNTANTIAQQYIAAKYEPLQAQVDNLKSYYQLAQNDMSESEKLQAQAEIQKQQSAVDFQQQKDLLAYKASLDAKANGGTYTLSNGQQVPQQLSPYYKVSYDGTSYIDLTSLTPSQKDEYAQLASQAGIKAVVNQGDADKLEHLAVTKSNLQDIINTFQAVPTEKVGFPAAQGVSNAVKSFFGDADIRAYQNYRTTAIGTLQALAGGTGSGLRINQAEVTAAVKDIPVLVGPNADTPASAQKKIDNLNSQLNKWQVQILGGGNTAANDAQVKSQTSSQDITSPQDGDTYFYNGVKYTNINGVWTPQ